jgi:hypothetical protein
VQRLGTDIGRRTSKTAGLAFMEETGWVYDFHVFLNRFGAGLKVKHE